MTSDQDPPHSKRKPNALPAWCVVMTFAVAAVFIYWQATSDRATVTSPSSSSPIKSDPERLTVGLLNDGQELGIANLDDFDWADCEFGLNPHGLSGAGYTFHATGFKAHSDGTLKLSVFTDDDGLLFDPGARVVKLVSVVCNTPYGNLVAVEQPKYIGPQ